MSETVQDLQPCVMKNHIEINKTPNGNLSVKWQVSFMCVKRESTVENI
jgi:hypothetical protein